MQNIQKRITTLAVCFVVVVASFVLTPVTTKAQDSLLFGQKQKYSAVVRSDGKIIVYGKIILNNSDKNELKQTSFTVPEGVEIDNLSVYQITLPEHCTAEQEEKQSTSTAPEYINQRNCADIENEIFESGDNYYYYYQYGSNNDALVYKSIKPHQNNNTYNLSLPEPIQPQKQGAYMVAYSVDKGYMTQQFGVYKLSFKTLQVPDSVNEVQVGIDLSSDLYAKEKPSSIEGNTSQVDNLSLKSTSGQSDASMTNEGLDKLQESIGQNGVFVKTGKGLLPNETFVVNGEFADAAWKLHLGWIIGGVVALAVASLLVYFLLRKASAHEFEPVVRERKR